MILGVERWELTICMIMYIHRLFFLRSACGLVELGLLRTAVPRAAKDLEDELGRCAL